MDTTKEITRAILNAGRHSSIYDIFTDFLQAGLEDFGAVVPEWAPRSDADLHELVQLYRFSVYRAPPLRDILGPVYMDLASQGQKNRMGQHFTPWAVAYMMAGMQLGADGGMDPGAGGEPLVRICDPTCGSGVLLLASVEWVRKTHGDAAVERVSVTGVDVDWVCARMTALQLLANNAIHGLRFGEVVVVHGNSLTLEEFSTVLHATARPPSSDSREAREEDADDAA